MFDPVSNLSCSERSAWTIKVGQTQTKYMQIQTWLLPASVYSRLGNVFVPIDCKSCLSFSGSGSQQSMNELAPTFYPAVHRLASPGGGAEVTNNTAAEPNGPVSAVLQRLWGESFVGGNSPRPVGHSSKFLCPWVHQIKKTKKPTTGQKALKPGGWKRFLLTGWSELRVTSSVYSTR